MLILVKRIKKIPKINEWELWYWRKDIEVFNANYYAQESDFSSEIYERVFRIFRKRVLINLNKIMIINF